MASVTVSVVVGADRALVVDCLSSLLTAVSGHEMHARAICNQPDEALADDLRQRFPSVEVRTNAAPQGFARNHNQVAADATTEFLLFANDDLIFLGDSAAACLRFLELPENRNVASLSPRLLNTDGSLQRSTYGFPTLFRALLDLSGMRGLIAHSASTERLARWLGLDAGRSRFWNHDRTCDVETFRGASIFIRRAAWLEVGPLSEATLVGGEMAEWHKRCRDRGWRSVFFADASIVHHGSRTVGVNPMLQTEYLKGYLVYFGRHRSVGAVAAFRVLGVAIASLRLLVSTFTGDRIRMRLWRANLRQLIVGHKTSDKTSKAP